MFDEPITTVAQAKEFFMAMGCSGFHMSREYPDRYADYERLNISEQVETEWRLEKVELYFTDIIQSNENSELWKLQCSMAELTEVLRTVDVLEQCLIATRHIRDRVPLGDRVIVSETINGRRYRRYRSGLIYMAYDLQCLAMAMEFAALSLHFATYVEDKTTDFDRCQRATQTCSDIVSELGL